MRDVIIPDNEQHKNINFFSLLMDSLLPFGETRQGEVGCDALFAVVRLYN
jgi:hypothetical protein